MSKELINKKPIIFGLREAYLKAAIDEVFNDGDEDQAKSYYEMSSKFNLMYLV